MTLLYGFLRYSVYLVAKELTLNILKLILRSNAKTIFTRQFTECLVSIYLLFNLFALAFPSTIFTAPATEGLESVSFGLSELRSLLYNDFGWFLLLSTLVLLVALFGVAVITRNKK
jgi:NADH:ubiquinone oxidoreductase subunit 6 (subunit J)